MTFCDAHLHLVQCASLPHFSDGIVYRSCTCAHQKDEFARQKMLVGAGGAAAGAQETLSEGPSDIRCAFGIHPQMPLEENVSFLEELLKNRRICAIGETGFDFFTPDFKQSADLQRKMWLECIRLSAEYNVPLVIHNRKALDEMFKDIKLLKKVPCAVMHSFAFGPREAESILSHGVNAYFSFGKQILNGNRKSISCVSELPLERLLLETDAPYQTLRGEKETRPEEIVRVYEGASLIRKIPLEELCSVLEKNFLSAFGDIL